MRSRTDSGGASRRLMRAGIAGTMWVAAACGLQSPPVQSGSTTSGIHYEASGDGPPVVLIHGFSLDRRMWAGQVRYLEPHFRVVRYDLRGHGRSAGITAPFSAHDDLVSVLDELKIDHAVLVGHSAGAQVAADAALAYPGRVSGLVLAAPGLSGYVPTGPRDWMNPMIEAMRAGDVTRAVELWAETPLMAVPQNRSADSIMRSIVLENAGIWSASPTQLTPLDPPAIGRLGAIRVPTLVLAGDADLPDIRNVADTLQACIVGAQLEIIPNAGHMLNLAAPQRFNRAVLSFLRDPPPSPSDSERSPCS